MDTSVFTHFARAGRLEIIRALAPGGVALIPMEVHTEIERGRELHSGIPAVAALPWVEVVSPTEDEVLTMLQVKASLGGHSLQHLGECAVISCAMHRNLVAIIDDRAAIAQADVRSVVTHDSLWIAIRAYRDLFGRSREQTAALIDDLLNTDMRLPVESGESIMQWAYENGLLP